MFLYLIIRRAFLDAPSHLFKRMCPSVRPSARRSVGPSVRPSVPCHFQTRTRRILCRVSGLVFPTLRIGLLHTRASYGRPQHSPNSFPWSCDSSPPSNTKTDLLSLNTASHWSNQNKLKEFLITHWLNGLAKRRQRRGNVKSF